MASIRPELLIDPARIDLYLDGFVNFADGNEPALANPAFWEGRTVLVTGINGFVGSHLTEKLLSFGASVVGLVRRHSLPDYTNLSDCLGDVQLFEGNLSDYDSLLSLLQRTRPSVIFHLAAQSFVPTSFRAPVETYEINVVGTANLLQAVLRSGIPVEAVQIACSSEEYGLVYPEEAPITENNPLRPQSPYAVSKVAAEMVAVNHHKSFGIPVRITRAFNHTGPRRGLQFVTSVVARQIAGCILEGRNTVTIGNPSPVRDFTDVRDIIQGYMLAVEKGRDGEPYNLGHGRGITIENLVKLTADIMDVKAQVVVDRDRFRPAEVEILLCDYGKAFREIGYAPSIPLTRTMKDNVEHFLKNPWLINIERN